MFGRPAVVVPPNTHSWPLAATMAASATGTGSDAAVAKRVPSVVLRTARPLPPPAPPTRQVVFLVVTAARPDVGRRTLARWPASAPGPAGANALTPALA